MTEHLERELKLSVDGSFRLPELPGTALPDRTFTSTYHDTPDYRLARSSVTLRRRVENRRGLWQLKLPRGADRLELELPGPPSEVPSEMAELLAAYARGHALQPVAVLRTKRSGIRTDAATGAVADVTIDVVSVMADRKIIRSFRELEVELVEGDREGARRSSARRSVASGAGEGDGRAKLFQALDLERPAERPAPGRDASPAEHLQAMLETQYRAIVAHDAGTRLGRDPEELHKMRVATRRLRAFLRTGRPLLDADWAEALRLELRWLGGVLGPVRDLDVLIDHLRSDAHALDPGERRVLGRVFHQLEDARDGRSQLHARGARLGPLHDPARPARGGGRETRSSAPTSSRCGISRPGSSASCARRHGRSHRTRRTTLCTSCASAASGRATRPSSPSP